LASGGETAIFEETQEIIVLTVDVTANLDGRFQLKQNRLRDEDLTSLGTEITDLRFEQLNLLSRAATPHLQEAVDD
jgi:hypothetical protein